ncbi:hypothetical protein N7453_005903 [Penicillium expansum]|nr:hypothetical protein N7453_005903 [Penicillium expansum]
MVYMKPKGSNGSEGPAYSTEVTIISSCWDIDQLHIRFWTSSENTFPTVSASCGLCSWSTGPGHTNAPRQADPETRALMMFLYGYYLHGTRLGWADQPNGGERDG